MGFDRLSNPCNNTSGKDRAFKGKDDQIHRGITTILVPNISPGVQGYRGQQSHEDGAVDATPYELSGELSCISFYGLA